MKIKDNLETDPVRTLLTDDRNEYQIFTVNKNNKLRT